MGFSKRSGLLYVIPTSFEPMESILVVEESGDLKQKPWANTGSCLLGF